MIYFGKMMICANLGTASDTEQTATDLKIRNFSSGDTKMIEINGKKLCENCFVEISKTPCAECGYDPADSASDSTLLLPGSVLSEKYVIGSVIGIGGFGVTYLAYDKLTDSRVAVKEYFPRGIARRSSDGAAVITVTEDDSPVFEAGADKLYNESRIVSGFKDNPNIIKIFDFFRANNTVYLTMEFLHGKTLKEYIRDHGTLGAAKAAHVAQCVLNALSAVHKANVLHRDISPDNIILCANGDVKLIDFGAARRIVAERTQNFSAIVKFGFAPPEQYSKSSAQGAWSDIYSLGATLYYALTGDIPSDPLSRFENDDTFGENNFGIEDGLWNVIVKAASLSSGERYQSAAEMSSALEQLPVTPEPIIFPADGILSSKLKLYGRSFVPTAPSAESKKGGKKNFRTKRSRAAAAVASIAVISACIIVPAVLKSSKPSVYPGMITDYDAVFRKNSDEDSDEPKEPPVPLTETYPYFAEYSSKPYYINMSERERGIYETIYSGLTERMKKIELPSQTYKYSEVRKCYFQVIYDNPWICDIGDFGARDADENEITDPEEYVDTVIPGYLNVYYHPDTFRECIEQTLNETDRTDSIEALRYIHDKMINTVSVVARYTTQSCTHAYGSIVDWTADDMGFAQGFCVYAQALGLPCRVIDGTKDGGIRAWCAVKINDTWYNVDVYGDMFAHNDVLKIRNTDRNAVFHTYFLANDRHFKELGYEPDGGWESLGGEEFSADSPYDNYYIRHIRGIEEYFCKDAQTAYESLLEKTAEAAEDGRKEVSACVSPIIADEVYSKMSETFISDCEEKYGISLLGCKVEYTPEEYRVELTL